MSSWTHIAFFWLPYNRQCTPQNSFSMHRCISAPILHQQIISTFVDCKLATLPKFKHHLLSSNSRGYDSYEKPTVLHVAKRSHFIKLVWPRADKKIFTHNRHSKVLILTALSITALLFLLLYYFGGVGQRLPHASLFFLFSKKKKKIILKGLKGNVNGCLRLYLRVHKGIEWDGIECI